MATNFITNETGKALRARLIELIEGSDELKFLVGFFYFSGLHELYEGLKNNPTVNLKVLVGMNVDKLNYNLVEYADDDQTASNNEKLDKYFRGLQQSLTSEDFDTPMFYEQVSFFVDLIKQDRLIIRKTQEPNHAKIYFFFDRDNLLKKKVFITGSSNLTRPALTTQAEFNVEICDYGTEETEKYFDELWEDAIKITEKDEVKKKLISVIEKNTMARKVTPFEAYALALKTYLDSFKRQNISSSLPELLKAHGYTPYRYQLDAVEQALAIIKDYNGVIIADVVGLGKTIIACAVARELRKRGLVICPPNLMGDRDKKSGWRMYLEQFGLTDWEVRSGGDLENTAEYVQRIDDFEVVIIDEAHRFRNQDTKDYEFLKNICRNKIVILLTATPFNNRPSDILSLLKLFITPKKSSITLENNLVSRFRSYQVVFEHLSYISRYHNSPFSSNRNRAHNYYEGLFGEPNVDLSKVKQRAQYLAAEIRDVIEPVTIRRNRLDLQNNPAYKNEVKQLSKIADPEEWYFALSEEQSAFYDQIIKVYFGAPEEGGRFKGAIYRPFEYETEKPRENLEKEENFEFIQQRNLFDFMRRLMVMRFESSFGSFEQSIRRFKSITEHALEFILKTDKYILDRSLLEKIYSKDEEEIETELANFSDRLLNGNYPKNNRIYELDKFAKKDEFLADIHSDLLLFDEIIARLKQMDLVADDPKGNCLVEHVQAVLSQTPKPGEPKRKVVIFSQYKDTVNHLRKKLEPVFNDRLLTVSGNLSSSVIDQINRNFDASYKSQDDNFDIMLSTDRLSEGFNLNRAGMVINYDIPWNPVRVIQRVGRINRISKKVFDELYIVNFFPTEKGATEVKSREIAQNKMFLIHNVLGEDAKIFDVDEEPTASGLFERLTQSPDELEEESFYTKVLKLYTNLKESYPELAEELEQFPLRVKVAKAGAENELLVLMRKNRLFIQAKAYNGEPASYPYPLSFEQALPHITCAFEEPALPLSEAFWQHYQQTKEIVEETREALSANSIETKAYNNLKTLIRLAKRDEELAQFQQFIVMLLEDITDYATLPDFTLRRIANLETTNGDKRAKLLKEIKELQAELGVDYLEKEKEQLKQTHKEIIIAIENQVL